MRFVILLSRLSRSRNVKSLRLTDRNEDVLRVSNVKKVESDKIGPMSNGLPIETLRLRLVLLTPEALDMLRHRNYEGASSAQGFAFSDDFLLSVNDAFLKGQLEGIRKRPLTPGWSVRAILRKDDDLLIGTVDFMGLRRTWGERRLVTPSLDRTADAVTLRNPPRDSWIGQEHKVREWWSRRYRRTILRPSESSENLALSTPVFKGMMSTVRSTSSN
jgi:hypothetical protein